MDVDDEDINDDDEDFDDWDWQEQNGGGNLVYLMTVLIHTPTIDFHQPSSICFVTSSEASPTIWSCYENLGIIHFFKKLIPY